MFLPKAVIQCYGEKLRHLVVDVSFGRLRLAQQKRNKLWHPISDDDLPMSPIRVLPFSVSERQSNTSVSSFQQWISNVVAVFKAWFIWDSLLRLVPSVPSNSTD